MLNAYKGGLWPPSLCVSTAVSLILTKMSDLWDLTALPISAVSSCAAEIANGGQLLTNGLSIRQILAMWTAEDQTPISR
jgi:hypothetical protein